MDEDSSRPHAPQATIDLLGELQPFLILRKRDNSLAVAALGEGNLISLAPLVVIPDPPRRTALLECPCCRRPFVMSEWPNGMMRLRPFDDGERP